MADKSHSLMFSGFIKHMLLVCFVSMSIMACDRSEQTKKKITAKPILQNSENKEIVTAVEPLIVDSADIDLMIARGNNYYLKKEFQKAINQMLVAYKTDDQNVSTLITLGNLYFDTDQNVLAIEFYEKALELTPDNASTRCDMATCYSRVGMLDKAIEINRKTIEMDNTHAQSHHNLAVFLKNTGKLAEAQEEMRIYNKLISGEHN